VADAVAIVSVVSTAVVALGSALITAVSTSKQQQERSRSKTRRDRENELRNVAEDAALKLTYAIYLLGKAGDDLSLGGADLELFNKTYGDIWNLGDRLAIRLGNDEPEVTSYRTAINQVDRARHLVTAPDQPVVDNAAAKREFEENKEGASTSQKEFTKLISRRLSPDAHDKTIASRRPWSLFARRGER
jgi:hypothetical protein